MNLADFRAGDRASKALAELRGERGWVFALAKKGTRGWKRGAEEADENAPFAVRATIEIAASIDSKLACASSLDPTDNPSIPKLPDVELFKLASYATLSSKSLLLIPT